MNKKISNAEREELQEKEKAWGMLENIRVILWYTRVCVEAHEIRLNLSRYRVCCL
jgi:hypothetical protein